MSTKPGEFHFRLWYMLHPAISQIGVFSAIIKCGDSMRILIIEDDDAISHFIAGGLEQQGFACDIRDNGPAGLETAGAHDYDCLIIDIMLPDLSGLEIIRELRGRGYKTPIIILSARTAVDNRLEGFEAGADDYLTKPFSFAELQARVQALLRRAGGRSGRESAASNLSCGFIELDRIRRVVLSRGESIELPKREFALLEYLLVNQGNVVSKTMILEHIWDYHFDPQTNVVDVLVHRLRTKVDPGHELIHTVRGTGYVLREN
jgi:two-component system OmpR family response regulator